VWEPPWSLSALFCTAKTDRRRYELPGFPLNTDFHFESQVLYLTVAVDAAITEVFSTSDSLINRENTGTLFDNCRDCREFSRIARQFRG
jgi:hypothetical protein